MIHADYEFDEIADKISYPAYDEIADEIIRKTGITHGKADCSFQRKRALGLHSQKSKGAVKAYVETL